MSKQIVPCPVCGDDCDADAPYLDDYAKLEADLAAARGETTIPKLMRDAFATAKAKGFWKDHDQIHTNPLIVGVQIGLIVSEAVEALEAWRLSGDVTNTYGDNGKPEGLPSELADVVIRVAQLCEAMGVDLEGAIGEKMRYNETRPLLHGGRRF